jgi:hypothetical protein
LLVSIISHYLLIRQLRRNLLGTDKQIFSIGITHHKNLVRRRLWAIYFRCKPIRNSEQIQIFPDRSVVFHVVGHAGRLEAAHLLLLKSVDSLFDVIVGVAEVLHVEQFSLLLYFPYVIIDSPQIIHLTQLFYFLGPHS